MENDMRFLAISLCALAVLPVVSGAQQSSQLSSRGPTIQAAAVGFRATDAKANASTKVSAAPLIARHQGQDVAFMAVGVGAMIAGALIGDTAGTIILIGGAAVALFGLYHYLE
jgi:cytochrome c biogenesis protein CcdA